MSDHFITEFGHRIDFVPGYFEQNAGYCKFLMENDIGKKPASLLFSSGLLASEHVAFSKLISFMARFGLPGKYKRGLDLGGAEGTLMRLFKAAGVVQESSSVDLVDYSDAVSEQTFLDYLEYARQPQKFTPKMQRSARKTKVAFDYLPEQPIETGLITNFPHAPTLDHAHVGDLMAHEGQYDLVTVVSVLSFFSMNRSLAKIRSLLVPGGVFVGQIELWWFIANSTGLVGQFPYAAQRLSRNDLKRYYSEHLPEMLPAFEKRYDWFHEGQGHPTLNDWVTAAKSHGLRPVGIDRIVPTGHNFLSATPAQLFKEPWFDYRDVLRDVNLINPQVTAEDMMTAHFMIALIAE